MHQSLDLQQRRSTDEESEGDKRVWRLIRRLVQEGSAGEAIH